MADSKKRSGKCRANPVYTYLNDSESKIVKDAIEESGLSAAEWLRNQAVAAAKKQLKIAVL